LYQKIYMEMSQENSLCSYLKQKCHYFSFPKSENRRKMSLAILLIIDIGQKLVTSKLFCVLRIILCTKNYSVYHVFCPRMYTKSPSDYYNWGSLLSYLVSFYFLRIWNCLNDAQNCMHNQNASGSSNTNLRSAWSLSSISI
jgi:hypothetical protein